MNQDRTEEPVAPDAELGAALRGLRAEPPVSEADWEALRRRVAGAAELPLARRRRFRAARWAAALVPLATAAGLAFLVWAQPDAAPSELPEAERARLAAAEEELVGGELSDQDFLLLVTGRDNPEELLQIALETP